MNTYKIKSGLFLLAFVVAAVSYHLYEKEQQNIPAQFDPEKVVELQAEDLEDLDPVEFEENKEDPTP